MPFKNMPQLRACFAKHDPKWDCHKWAHETPNIKNIPKKAGKKKKSKCFKEWLFDRHPKFAVEPDEDTEYAICHGCQEEVMADDLDEDGLCPDCREDKEKRWEPIK